MKVRWEIVKLSLKSISLLSWMQNALVLHSFLVGKQRCRWFPLNAQRRNEKRSLKQISMLQIGEGANTMCTVSEVLLCYKSTENSSHEFQKFLSLLYFLPPSPKAPSAQIMNVGVTQSSGIFVAVYVFTVGEADVKCPEVSISRAGWGSPWEGKWLHGGYSAPSLLVWRLVQHWEKPLLWAVANNPCTLMPSVSLPCQGGYSW